MQIPVVEKSYRLIRAGVSAACRPVAYSSRTHYRAQSAGDLPSCV